MSISLVKIFWPKIIQRGYPWHFFGQIFFSLRISSFLAHTTRYSNPAHTPNFSFIDQPEPELKAKNLILGFFSVKNKPAWLLNQLTKTPKNQNLTSLNQCLFTCKFWAKSIFFNPKGPPFGYLAKSWKKFFFLRISWFLAHTTRYSKPAYTPNFSIIDQQLPELWVKNLILRRSSVWIFNTP